ncbi:beta-N-acetylhexosaminidase [Snuella sedimenti]|uniref:beta-N-acetylhexosaminidase n=1 Tax=Snuella sedimenti TaxID=2798802 RepID=A0A8J7LY78_9FLAO|nr:beta-N-acetylhexosaminidase [Snuella sedimenti]MBJ6368066.1 beta-N-acetylhexosaminidase [Snuella sedimenti]
MKLKAIYLITLSLCCLNTSLAQTILPTPMGIKPLGSRFEFKASLKLAYDGNCLQSALWLEEKLGKYVHIEKEQSNIGDIVLKCKGDIERFGEEGYGLQVDKAGISISSSTDAGIFYGIQSFFQLLPVEVQTGKAFNLKDFTIDGTEIIDQPKYSWRSFMIDSGRQYQTPQFIKRYLDYMAMMKINVFHWHLTEGQGWRIEIKKYPKLAEVGSKVATGKEQQGYYTQDEIRDIVAYAKKLHIMVVPEIDVPGHSEAALIAYPEMTCFGKAPETVMGFSPNLFCGGKESTYAFIEDILDEVSELFPSKYIHLGGDEAPKANWDKCPNCLKKIEEEHLNDSHDLQLYFSSRLANYMKTKGKKVIFWGDVVYNEGTILPDNVVIQWWNSRGHGDLALKNAIKRGHPVICNTNQYTYLNFPLVPWSRYKENRTFDIKKTYEDNTSDLENPDELVLGMGACIWTDWYVLEHMIDQRVFPRLFSLAEQMWHKGARLDFETFYGKVKQKYPLLTALGIDYGPALLEEVPEGYKWD